MKRQTTLLMTFLAVALMLVAFQNVAFACDSCKAHAAPASNDADGHHGDMKGHDHAMMHGDGEHMCKIDADGKAKGPTMGAVFSGHDLYTCPMHSQIITDNPEAKCPLCNMDLVKMDEEAVEALQASHPEGCVMCPIVKSGVDHDKTCEICKMKLREIPKPDMKMDSE